METVEIESTEMEEFAGDINFKQHMPFIAKGTKRVKCSVPTCESRSNKTKLKFFKFPKNPTRFNIWVKSIGLTHQDLKVKNKFVCEKHFARKYVGVNKLTQNAVPMTNESEAEIITDTTGPSNENVDIKEVNGVENNNLDANSRISFTIDTQADGLLKDNSGMGNANATEKVIEISDSDNEDGTSLPLSEAKDKPTEKNDGNVKIVTPAVVKPAIVTPAVVNSVIVTPKKLINNPPSNDDICDIIIDSDDEDDPPPKEKENSDKNDILEVAKTYYEPEFVNIETLNKIETKTSTLEPKPVVDKNEKSKGESEKNETTMTKVIELIDDMETDEGKKDKDVDQPMEVVTVVVAADNKTVESIIIDLDQNDANDSDEKEQIDQNVILEKNKLEETSTNNVTGCKENDEMVEVFVLDKDATNNQDHVVSMMETAENEKKTESPSDLVDEIIQDSAPSDNQTKVEEEVIDLDDSGDSETLADNINEKSTTLEDLVNNLNIEGPHIDETGTVQAEGTSENNTKATCTTDPVSADEEILEQNLSNLEKCASSKHTDELKITKITNPMTKLDDIIDLDANESETAVKKLNMNSEEPTSPSDDLQKNNNILKETNNETEIKDKSSVADEQNEDDDEIICLDGNDSDDNKAIETPHTDKIPQEIDSENGKKDNSTNDEDNIEPVKGVHQSNDAEAEVNVQTKDAEIIDLDTGTTKVNLTEITTIEHETEIEVPAKEVKEIANNDDNFELEEQTNQSNDVEMETDNHDTGVIDLDIDNNEDDDNANDTDERNKQDTIIESNSKINATDEDQAIVKEVEPQPQEQPEGAVELTQLDKNTQVKDNITVEIKSGDDKIILNETDTKMDVDEIAIKPMHECVNYHCNKTTSTTFPAPIFVLSFYRINKKCNKRQFVCEKCYDDCVTQYEQMTGDIIAHKPILFKPESQPDLIELSDSDEEDSMSSTKRNNPGSNKARSFIENNESNRNVLGNLEDLIEKAFSQINIDMQLKKRTDIINKTIEKNEAASTALFNEIRELQKSADKMHFTLYQKYPNRIIKELPPIDLNKEDTLNLPPIGDVSYPDIQTGKRYLAPRHIISGAWVECEALEKFPNHPTDSRKHGTHWKVMFCRRATKLTLNIKHMAYSVPPDVRLNVGTRVVAIFQQVPVPKQSFFPGIVGEALKDSNKYRYLIFFDDGYCQYVKHEHVRLICEVSPNVWEDIDGNPGTSRFIQEFLTQYHNRISRPMLLAKRGQKIVTEFNGIWKLSKVVDVDCNLIKMYIEKNQTFEWIYRGSSRFAPIFKHRQIGNELQLKAINYHLKKRNEPYIEMTLDESSDNYQSNDNNRSGEMVSDPKGLGHPIANRAVARKSTNQGSKNYNNNSNGSMNKAPVSLNNHVIVVDDDKMPKGKVTYYETTKRYSTTTYVAHKCTPSCLVRVEDNLEPFNPIARPLLSGWERQICKYKSRKIAIYRAPCGRRLRTMLEVHKYLRLTESPLNVECFDYDTTMHCLAEYTDMPQYIRNTDLSDGTEKMPISCCNYFDKTTPPTCTYSTNRIPTEGVNLNLDPDFLCACDCEDDCIDKSKCQCWQLTIKGACSINSGLQVDEIGYCFKRLLSPVPTGIYECNSRCKCKQNCLNRVVQHPLSVKLQVFKTTNRGWGLRTLHDIPKGSFICIYAGDLLTEQSSNELGAKEGDEYFAELDYIEAVEGLKEGYESDIPREEGDDEIEGERDDDFENSAESDDDDFTSKCKAINKKITTRSSTRTAKNQDSKKTNSSSRPIATAVSATVIATPSTEDDDCITISDDEEVRAPVNFIPNTSYDDDTEVDSKYKSVRKLFGKDELGYVMDAKRTGNIGRYFNHSCNPNLFVQNVFVDTHDLRFPWVTFFSNTSIQAGTELTWNYNYDVGCVPGKVLYCQCDSSNCRGRLL